MLIKKTCIFTKKNHLKGVKYPLPPFSDVDSSFCVTTSNNSKTLEIGFISDILWMIIDCRRIKMVASYRI